MWQDSRVHLFFVRHGKPEEYGADFSPLCEEGKRQVGESARYFNQRLNEDSGEKKRAIYLHSDRIRARQTSNLLALEARKFIQQENLQVEISEVASPHSYISAQNTLTKFMEEYKFPKELAASVWLRLPHEQAMKIGIRSSEVVANEARLLISELMLRASQDYPNDSSIYYFLGTHETTLMAMLYHMPPHREFKIGYAEFIEIGSSSGHVRLNYKPKGLFINYWDNNKGFPKSTKDFL